MTDLALLALGLAACDHGATRAQPARDAAIPRADATVVTMPAPRAIDAAPPPDALDRTRRTFDGRPGWLILGEHSHRYAEVDEAAQLSRLDGLIDAHVIDTGVFANLKPGYFAVVYGRFDTRADAAAAADGLPDVYVKQSGPVRPMRAGATAPPTLNRIVGSFDPFCDTGTVVIRGPDADGGVVELASYELWTSHADPLEPTDNEIWTNLTGPVELVLASKCSEVGKEVECADEGLDLPAGGGDVEARFDCHEYVGE